MEVPGECRKLHTEGFHHIANIRAVRSRRMRWVIADMREIKNAWKVLGLR
jgi:hypothetical protein